MLAHAGPTALASPPPRPRLRLASRLVSASFPPRPRLAPFVPACATWPFRPALAAPHPFGCPPARPPRAQRVTQRPQPGRAAMTVKYLASRQLHHGESPSDRAQTHRGGPGNSPLAAHSPQGHRPGWRNWQTQRTQNPPRATSWGFDPPSRHQSTPKKSALPYVAGDRPRGQRCRRLSRARANPHVALHRSRVADDQHMPVRRRAERDIRQTVFARARSGPA